MSMAGQKQGCSREEVFHIEGQSAEGYWDFIRTISSKYLPGDSFPTDDFHITLITHSHRVKLKLNADKFQLKGYQIDHPHDRWFEFGFYHSWKRHSLCHDIPGSSFLRLSNDLSYLEAALTSGHSIYEIVLGQHTLSHAVDSLATSKSRSRRAWSLLVVNLMICEALRLPVVAIFLKNTFFLEYPLHPRLIDLIRRKEDMLMHTIASIPTAKAGSEAEVKFKMESEAEAEAEYEVKALSEFDYQSELELQADAESELEVKPKTTSKPKSGCPYVYTLSTVSDYFAYHLKLKYLEREPPSKLVVAESGKQVLADVFAVRNNNVNGKVSGDKFQGTIYATDSYFAEPIYEGENEEPAIISSGDNLLLTGPKVCIPVDDLDLSFNFVILGRYPSAYDHISWRHSEDGYNKPLTDEFVTDYCSMMLSFIVLRRAVQATVEVKVLSIDGGDGGNDAVVTRVYGEISAYSTKFKDEYEIMLFQKTQKEKVEVHSGELLKLSRDVVAVPWKSSLIIQVDLYDSGEFPFAKCSAKFSAKCYNAVDMEIFGARRKIQVKVSWP